MASGNRGLVFSALVGLMAFSASAGGMLVVLSVGRSNSDAYPSYFESVSIANGTAIPNIRPIKPARRVPCHAPLGAAESALCAQWRSTSSGADAARWAWWQLVLNGLGLLALGGTLWFTARATAAASSAAKAAEDSIAHSHSLAQIELRAYVDVDSPKLEAQPADDTSNEKAYKSTITFKNFGSTPAASVRFRTEFYVRPEPPDPLVSADKTWVQAGSIAQNDQINYFHNVFLNSSQSTDITRGTTQLYEVCEIIYQDVFGNEYERSFMLTTNKDMSWTVFSESELKLNEKAGA